MFDDLIPDQTYRPEVRGARLPFQLCDLSCGLALSCDIRPFSLLLGTFLPNCMKNFKDVCNRALAVWMEAGHRAP